MAPATKAKILIALVIITSLFGHLEWGQNNQMFLFQAEAEIFIKIITEPLSVLHPFTVLPLQDSCFNCFRFFRKNKTNCLFIWELQELAFC